MRRFLVTSLVLLASALSGLRAEDVARDQAAVEKSVARGATFLLSQQDESGAMSKQDKGRNHANAYTALSIMALVATGHQPTDDTPEGRGVLKALEFILREDRQDSTGYFGKSDGSRMYGHGITTLMLAEMMGMGTDLRQNTLIRDRCQKAVDLIVRAQKVQKHDPRFHGGWRYTPEDNSADLSVTVWQVMALRAAKNAGLSVPRETIDAAVSYIKRSYQSGRDASGKLLNMNSSFSYEPGGHPVYSTAAEGLLALQVCGEYDTPELIGTTEWFRDHKPNTQNNWFYYGTYYYAQGMYQRGGDCAKQAQQTVETVLLAEQKEDGSWQGRNQEGMSRIYSTSMALLSLSVRYHFMPIYQR